MDDSSYAGCGLILSWSLLGAGLAEVMVQDPLFLKDNNVSVKVSTWTFLHYRTKTHCMHHHIHLCATRYDLKSSITGAINYSCSPPLHRIP
jgi:hypothetical protein